MMLFNGKLGELGLLVVFRTQVGVLTEPRGETIVED